MSGNIISPTDRSRIVWGLIVMVFILATAFRYQNRLINPWLETDAAFHYRMISDVADNGRLPTTDTHYLQVPPRDPSMMSPPLMYDAFGLSFYVLRNMGLPSLLTYTSTLNSVLSILPVIPLAWLVWLLTRSLFLTLLGSSLLAVISPLYIRFLPSVPRFESGSLLLVLTVCALLATRGRMASPRFDRLIAPALLLSAFLGTGYWRLFPFFLAMVLGIWYLAGFMDGKPIRNRLAPIWTAIGGLAAIPAFSFYRQEPLHHGIFVLPLLLVLPVPAILQLPPLQRTWSAFSPRRRWIILILIMATVAGGAFLFVPLLRVRLTYVFTSGPLPLTGSVLYSLLVAELLPFPIDRILDSRFFSYLPILYVLLITLWIFRPRFRPRATFVLLGVMFFGLLGLCFYRFAVFFIPFFILHLMAGFHSLGREGRQKWGSFPPQLFTVLLPAVLILPATGLFVAQNLEAVHLLNNSDTNRTGSISWLAEHCRPGDVVVSHWDLGYELETNADVTAVMDGFLESTTNRARILEFEAALLATNEDQLAEFCRRMGAKYLLLDNSSLIRSAELLKLPIDKWYRTEKESGRTRVTVLPAGRKIIVLRCFFDPGGLKYFVPVIRYGNYLVLQPRAARSPKS